MIKKSLRHPHILAAVIAGCSVLLHPVSGQSPSDSATTVETAAAIPVDEATATGGQEHATETARTPAADAAGHGDNAPIPDYKEQIGNGLKERERRLTLLNEAMMKLREAGEMEDASRVEERIRALLEMPPPSQTSTRLRAEVEQLRTKNDDLSLQLLALQEELKRYRPATQGSTSKRVASDR